jgi:hypothetical protein
MKGFMHIVEIIIIAIVIFVVIMQFLSIPLPEIDWSRTKLGLQANDVLYSLEGMGINWFDKDQLAGNLSLVFNDSNVVYNLKLKNIIKPEILVGCICNDSEKRTVEDLLESFEINGRETKFFVEQINPLNRLFL